METPSFGERIEALKEIATALRQFAETIMIEAQRMQAVQSRFRERVEKRSAGRARR
ncbi:MAG TPA: hypothetical protein VFB45_04650 [Pseudolabrys sp.]|nr:hypothetical protein [Pseudolabrys sp.]